MMELFVLVASTIWAWVGPKIKNPEPESWRKFHYRIFNPFYKEE